MRRILAAVAAAVIVVVTLPAAAHAGAHYRNPVSGRVPPVLLR